MKNNCIFFVLLACLSASYKTSGQISQKLWGQNFWDYNWINTNNPGLTLAYFQWSGATIIRIGGQALNTNAWNAVPMSTTTIKQMVLDVKNNQMIPIVQIPLGTKSQSLDINLDVLPYAKQLIDQLNQNGPNSPEFTLYWSIGNELDIDADNQNHQFDRFGFTISQIHSKITSVMNYMQNYHSTTYPNNGSLKFLGPELSYYRDHAESNTQSCPNCSADYGNMITNLTSGSYNLVSGNTTNLDYFSFHYYATADQGKYNAETIKPDRISLLKTLRNSVSNWGSSGNVTPLATNLNSLKSKLGTSAKIAITEANICTANAVSGSTQNVTMILNPETAQIVSLQVNSILNLSVSAWTLVSKY